MSYHGFVDSDNVNRETENWDIGRYIVNACIQWARIRGYSDATGLLRGLTIISKEPASLEDLIQKTGYSKSTVSANMKLLDDLGLVKRIVIPGDRRHLYAPIIDPEVIKSNLLSSIRREVQIFCEALDRTERDLKAGGAGAGYLLERVATLRRHYELIKKTVDVLGSQSANETWESLDCGQVK